MRFGSLVIVCLVACGAASSAPHAGGDCVQNGSVYSCSPSGTTYPACPAEATNGMPCTAEEPSCMGCYQGTEFMCGCVPDDAGPNTLWSCGVGDLACQCALPSACE